VQPERPAAFFWVGGRGRSTLGVFSIGSCPLTMQHHVTFQVKLEDVLAAPLRLRSAGIIPLGGGREPISEPVVFAWGPAASIFFDDPVETSWSTSRCCLIHHSLSWDCCPGANGEQSRRSGVIEAGAGAITASVAAW
jgi:hypothetical protein